VQVAIGNINNHARAGEVGRGRRGRGVRGGRGGRGGHGIQQIDQPEAVQGAGVQPPVQNPQDLLRVRLSARPEEYVEWQETADILIDPVNLANEARYMHRTRFAWDQVYGDSDIPEGPKPPYMYWLLLGPSRTYKRRIWQYTNTHVQNSHGGSTLEFWMLDACIGIQLALTLEGRDQSFETLWESTAEPGTVFQAPDYSRRFQIPVTVFRKFRKYLRLGYFFERVLTDR
jgi:hypothetical protein